jgi:hypothetical protein
VQAGDRVCAGQKIGETDSTGLSTGPHLHFEFAPKGNYRSNAAMIDPTRCIDTTKKPFAVTGTWTGSVTVTDETNDPVTHDVSHSTLNATNVTLTAVNCNGIVQTDGQVELTTTSTRAQTCTSTVKSIAMLTGLGERGGALSFGAPEQQDVGYSGSFGADFTSTGTDSCDGPISGSTWFWWLNPGLQHTPLDLETLTGTKVVDDPIMGSHTEINWHFHR